MLRTLIGLKGLLVGLLLSTSAAVHPAKAADTRLLPRPITPDDLLNLQTITDPQVSPDGLWVAYVVSTNDRSADESRNAIWMVSWDGTQQVQLTNPVHGTGSPRWSPDGRYVSYLAAPPGSANSQIMLLDRRGGEARTLTNLTEEVESYSWSPDGKRLVLVVAHTLDGAQPIVIDSLYFKEDRLGYLGAAHKRHLWLLDILSRKLVPLTEDPTFNEDLPAWSPDGRQVAFIRTHEERADPDGMIDIDLIEARSASQARKLVRVSVPYGLLSDQRLAWSSDGQSLAFLQGQEAKYGQYSQDRLVVVNTAAGSLQPLSDSLDRDVISFIFNGESMSITALVEDDGTTYPVLVDARSHSVKKLALGNAVLSNLSAAGGHTVVLSSNDRSPPEIFALEGEHLRQLTRHNDAQMADLQLGAVEDIRFDSRDGTPIHGLLVKPPNFAAGRKYPAILWIHGGPDEQDEHSFGFDDNQAYRQVLAANGFIVLGVNYRGSSGRGDAFAHAIAADWGHKEVEDLLAGIDYLVRMGLADPDRLGIAGWSYGGVLTDYTIASDSRFKAAVSGAGLGNPLGVWGTDQFYLQYRHEFGDPWQRPEVYMRLAYPLLRADHIRTPTLFAGGERDVEVPIAGGEQMYLALRTLGIPAELVVYPGQFHSLTRPSFIKDFMERMTAWFRQNLVTSSAPAGR